MTTINWYPGHMKKTKDLIAQHLKLVDVCVELLDARIPYSSRNPQFDQLVQNKPRVVVLNKADLADQKVLNEWIAYYKDQGIEAIPMDSMKGAGVPKLLTAVQNAAKEKLDRWTSKGMAPRAIRLMIIGIPNVGKSSLINKLVGKKSAKTGNKPGVTKGKQWVRIRKDIELFDTPGILWPKIEQDEVGMHLAFTGAIKDEIMHLDDLAFHLIKELVEAYPVMMKDRYELEDHYEETIEIMDHIARTRGCIKKGNQLDYEKVARLVLDEYRKGVIGRICLERPSDALVLGKDV